MNRIILIIICLFVLCAANMSFAKPPVPPPGELKFLWKHEDILLSKLNLNEQQRLEVKQIREEMQAEIEPLKAQWYEIIAEIRLLWMSPEINRQKLMDKSWSFHEMNWKLIQREIDYRMKMRDILRRDQCLKFIDLGGF